MPPLHSEVLLSVEISESAGAKQTNFFVMACEGAPSTTCRAGLDNIVGGQPAPTMTVSAVKGGIGAFISKQAL